LERQATPSVLNIDDSIKELAISFADRFNSIQERYPKLRLDFSFPSVGVVELVLAHLRGITNFSNQEEQLVRGAAAYLAYIAAHAWASIPDDLVVTATIDSTSEIAISVRNGIFLTDGSSFTINILSDLKEELEKASSKDLVLESFAMGLFSGLCPNGKGNWKNLTAKEFAVYLDPIEQFLCLTTAEYFKAVYPDETFDNLPEIFKNSLVLPPHGFDEPFIGLRGATLLLEFLNKEGYSDKAVLDFVRKLSAMPTRQLSTIGKILTLSLTDEVRAGSTTIDPNLRGAVCAIRNQIFGETDWLSQISNSDRKSPESMNSIQESFERELEQGLIPNVILPGRLIFGARYKELFTVLTWNEIELGIKGCEALLEAPSADDFSILLQNVALLIESENYQSAVEKISLATLALSSASIDQSVTFFQTAGDLYLRVRDFESAHEYLKRGMEQGAYLQTDILPSLFLSSLISLQRFEEAVQKGKILRERFPFSGNIALAISVAAIETNDPGLAQELISETLWNDPNNQAAFWIGFRV
jgi:hypothetical protein